MQFQKNEGPWVLCNAISVPLRGIKHQKTCWSVQPQEVERDNPLIPLKILCSKYFFHFWNMQLCKLTQKHHLIPHCKYLQTIENAFGSWCTTKTFMRKANVQHHYHSNHKSNQSKFWCLLMVESFINCIYSYTRSGKS